MKHFLRNVSWIVAVCGSLLGLGFIAADLAYVLHWPRMAVQPDGSIYGLSLCFIAGLVGASRGRDYNAAVRAVFGTLFLGIAVAMIGGPLAILAVSPSLTMDRSLAIRESLAVPFPMMLVLGGIAGGAGGALATWLKSPLSLRASA
jgi:hypothetical protein